MSRLERVPCLHFQVITVADLYRVRFASIKPEIIVTDAEGVKMSGPRNMHGYGRQRTRVRNRYAIALDFHIERCVWQSKQTALYRLVVDPIKRAIGEHFVLNYFDNKQ